MVERKHKFETEKICGGLPEDDLYPFWKKGCAWADTFCRLLTGLGVDEKAAASDACEMEHAVSAESYQALRTLVAEGNGGT